MSLLLMVAMVGTRADDQSLCSLHQRASEGNICPCRQSIFGEARTSSDLKDFGSVVVSGGPTLRNVRHVIAASFKILPEALSA